MEFFKAAGTLVVVLFLSLFFFLTTHPFSAAFAQEKVILKNVQISGNLRVEDDGIRLHLKSRAGEVFDPAVVDQDVKAIYRMGFFDDVQAELSPDAVLTYAVKEKPFVREVNIQGSSQVAKDKIESALGVTP